MMTRQDYERIAKAIACARREGAGGKNVGIVIGHLAKALKEGNPRFDKRRFINACKPEEEQEETTGMEQAIAESQGRDTRSNPLGLQEGERVRIQRLATNAEPWEGTFSRTTDSGEYGCVIREGGREGVYPWSRLSRIPSATPPATAQRFNVGDTVRIPDTLQCCGYRIGRITNAGTQYATVHLPCGRDRDIDYDTVTIPTEEEIAADQQSHDAYVSGVPF